MPNPPKASCTLPPTGNPSRAVLDANQHQDGAPRLHAEPVAHGRGLQVPTNWFWRAVLWRNVTWVCHLMYPPTSSPANMEPDRGLLEDNFPFKGTNQVGGSLCKNHGLKSKPKPSISQPPTRHVGRGDLGRLGMGSPAVHSVSAFRSDLLPVGRVVVCFKGLFARNPV